MLGTVNRLGSFQAYDVELDDREKLVEYVLVVLPITKTKNTQGDRYTISAQIVVFAKR